MYVLVLKINENKVINNVQQKNVNTTVVNCEGKYVRCSGFIFESREKWDIACIYRAGYAWCFFLGL